MNSVIAQLEVSNIAFIPIGEREQIRIPYALRRIPRSELASVVPKSDGFNAGEVVLAEVESVSKNTYVELATGRRSNLQQGVELALVFGNRYATSQYEGYARSNGVYCHLLCAGGMCGYVRSKHAAVGDPTTCRIIGLLADEAKRPLKLRNYTISSKHGGRRPCVVAVCGTSMDAGKTFTARSIIAGLCSQGYRVAAIKLTGSASARDTLSFVDAGACVALDFGDGGYPSTYLCSVEQLLDLQKLLVCKAASEQADYIVIEVADGLLQRETAGLISDLRFTKSIDAWILAATDAMGALGAVHILKDAGILPLAVSGLVSMSSLSVSEVGEATGRPCFSAKELRSGILNDELAALRRNASVAC